MFRLQQMRPIDRRRKPVVAACAAPVVHQNIPTPHFCPHCKASVITTYDHLVRSFGNIHIPTHFECISFLESGSDA